MNGIVYFRCTFVIFRLLLTTKCIPKVCLRKLTHKYVVKMFSKEILILENLELYFSQLEHKSVHYSNFSSSIFLRLSCCAQKDLFMHQF